MPSLCKFFVVKDIIRVYIPQMTITHISYQESNNNNNKSILKILHNKQLHNTRVLLPTEVVILLDSLYSLDHSNNKITILHHHFILLATLECYYKVAQRVCLKLS